MPGQPIDVRGRDLISGVRHRIPAQIVDHDHHDIPGGGAPRPRVGLSQGWGYEGRQQQKSEESRPEAAACHRSGSPCEGTNPRRITHRGAPARLFRACAFPAFPGYCDSRAARAHLVSPDRRSKPLPEEDHGVVERVAGALEGSVRSTDRTVCRVAAGGGGHLRRLRALPDRSGRSRGGSTAPRRLGRASGRLLPRAAHRGALGEGCASPGVRGLARRGNRRAAAVPLHLRGDCVRNLPRHDPPRRAVAGLPDLVRADGGPGGGRLHPEPGLRRRAVHRRPLGHALDAGDLRRHPGQAHPDQRLLSRVRRADLQDRPGPDLRLLPGRGLPLPAGIDLSRVPGDLAVHRRAGLAGVLGRRGQPDRRHGLDLHARLQDRRPGAHRRRRGRRRRAQHLRHPGAYAEERRHRDPQRDGAVEPHHQLQRPGGEVRRRRAHDGHDRLRRSVGHRGEAVAGGGRGDLATREGAGALRVADGAGRFLRALRAERDDPAAPRDAEHLLGDPPEHPGCVPPGGCRDRLAALHGGAGRKQGQHPR